MTKKKEDYTREISTCLRFESHRPSRILNRIFEGRTWEVFNTARAQFPSEIANVEQLPAKLTLEKKVISIDGEKLYAL
jgi:hypothetical protein